jgi:hypothetical protein
VSAAFGYCYDFIFHRKVVDRSFCFDLAAGPIAKATGCTNESSHSRQRGSDADGARPNFRDGETQKRGGC